MAEVKVAILGLERLGASFGLALKAYMADKNARHSFTITGHDDRGYNAKTAKTLGAVDNTVRQPHDAVKGAQIVVLAAPYHKTELLYQLIGPDLAPGAVVLDTSPLKRPSVGWVAECLATEPQYAAYMVGITPVLNPETLMSFSTEIDDARADLFKRGLMILAPDASSPPEAVELASEFARIVGATPHFMDVDEHDALVAAMEGLPAALSLAMFRTLSEQGAWSDMRRLTNPSFAAMTHHFHAHHLNSIWALLHYNRENTVRYLDLLLDTLQEVRDSLAEDADGLRIEAALEQSMSRYEAWEGQRHSNVWEKEDTGLPAGGVMQQVGSMFLGRRAMERGEKDEE
ncbi:MAG: prephenate dehydrogenase [Anaerolineae bacterium]|nr:prephenate dehydrogenase [Anaerolineae bacterium]